MVSPACSWSSQSASNSPCSPTISISLGLMSWPVPKTRTTFPSSSIALIRGIRLLPSSRPILQNKGSSLGPPTSPPRETCRLTGRRGRTKGSCPSVGSGVEPRGRSDRAMPHIAQVARDRRRPDLPVVVPAALPRLRGGHLGARPSPADAAPRRPVDLLPAGPLGDPAGRPQRTDPGRGHDVAGILVVRLVLAPMLRLWLSPAADSSSWMFHLSAGETPVASVPARCASDGMLAARIAGADRPPGLVLARGLGPGALVAGPRSELERVEADRAGLRPVACRSGTGRTSCGFTGPSRGRGPASPSPIPTPSWPGSPRPVGADGRQPSPRRPEGVFDA